MRSLYKDVMMGAMVFQITSLTIVYSIVYSGADQRKHQSSASVASVGGIHRWPVNSPHKWGSNAENVSIWWRHHGWQTFGNMIIWALRNTPYGRINDLYWVRCSLLVECHKLLVPHRSPVSVSDRRLNVRQVLWNILVLFSTLFAVFITKL